MPTILHIPSPFHRWAPRLVGLPLHAWGVRYVRSLKRRENKVDPMRCSTVGRALAFRPNLPRSPGDLFAIMLEALSCSNYAIASQTSAPPLSVLSKAFRISRT
ncbi:hypothetical protein VNO77_04030 [Canavalia gladiata]|uniref:Uncharacterized protein n=1 Tax=Canavalia gladiata TaxID=3824 RepID=A0AAN9MVS3_CANGL